MFLSLRKKPFILLGVALSIILVISVMKIGSSKTNIASKAESEEVAAESETKTDEEPVNEEETKKDTTTDVDQKVNQEPAVVQAEEKVEKDSAPVNREESTKQNTKETTTNNNKSVPATSQAKGNVANKKDDFSGIDTFWRNFRNAVLANNMSEVKRMTQFPLSTRGPMDTDPIIKINQDKFDKIFQNFLNQDDGLDRNSILGYIRSTENLSFKNSVDYDNSKEHIKTIRVDNNSAGISSMEFRLVNGEWKLILIYYKIN